MIIPPGPGVLCAYGDATTRVRDEASRTHIRRFGDTTAKEVIGIFKKLANQAAKTLNAEGVPRKDQTTTFQVDIRYHGQGLLLTVDFALNDLEKDGLDVIGSRFDDIHKHLFTFALPEDKELVNLRAVAEGKATHIEALSVPKGGKSPSKAELARHKMFVDGKNRLGTLYDRAKLRSGNVMKGPAIVLEMDSTTVILPGHVGKVDELGNILITPEA